MISSRCNLLSVIFAGLLGLGVAGCSRSPEAKEAAYLEKGKAFVAKQDYSRALLEFRNAIQVKPQDAEPYYQTGLVYLQLKSSTDAAASFRKALDRNPQHAGAQLRLAEMMSVSSDRKVVQDSEKRLSDLVAASPGNVEALDDLAFSEARLDKPEDAAAHLEDALRKSPAHVRSAVGLASLKLEQKDPAGAEAVLQKLIAAAPNTAEPHLALGQLYSREGKSAEAQQEAERALQIDPKNAPALIYLAEVQARQGHKDQAEATYGRLSALPDKRYRSTHALFLYQEGKRDAALAELQKLARDDPSDRAVRSYLIAAYVAMNQAGEGEKLLTAALHRDPKDRSALYQRGVLFLRDGKYNEAETDLRGVLKSQPNSAMAHYALAKTFQFRGAPLTYRQELGEALRWKADLLPARLELVRSLTGGGQAQSALAILDQMPAAQKNLLPAIETRNWVLLALGNNAEARQGVDRGLALQRSLDLVIQDGVLKMTTHDYAGARQAADEALLKNAADVRAVRLLEDSLVAQKQNGKVEERLRQLAEISPKSAPIQLMLGSWLAAIGKADEARAAFVAAKNADPKFDQAGIALARLDASQAKLDAARQELSEVLARNDRNVTARVMMGELDEKTGDSAGAVEQYRGAVQIAENNVVALSGLARALARVDPTEALAHAQKAVELAPDDPGAQDALGLVYYQKGSYEEASRFFQKAVEKQDAPRYRYHRGLTYLKLGKDQLGAKDVATALNADPGLAEEFGR